MTCRVTDPGKGCPPVSLKVTPVGTETQRPGISDVRGRTGEVVSGREEKKLIVNQCPFWAQVKAEPMPVRRLHSSSCNRAKCKSPSGKRYCAPRCYAAWKTNVGQRCWQSR